ncbi:polyamine-transporting ATPase 13A3-like isoform X4 [Macrobrachium rosenbergii]|uniref:polyamine-transporting ATPase 13A3-like isoform X4 n=1 Tax=Macrobrachium rosenbergii TaxID=79674 RepID=UPI0034D77B1B
MWRSKAVADRLNLGTKDEMEVTGYKSDKGKLALTVILTILSGGLLLIPLTWRPSIKLALTHKRCPLKEAKKLLLKDIYHQLWEEDVIEEDVPDKETQRYVRRTYFLNKKIKYIWDDITCSYNRLRPLEHGSTFSTFHQMESGLTGDDVHARKALYGENFMKIEILSIWQLLVEQAVNPFYIFQVFTVILWCIQEYFAFSGCILGLSAISITVMVWQTRKQSHALRKRITTESNVMVLRDGQRNKISSRELVPGDILLLKDDSVGIMEADAVLLEGSVITNEAMLTGESIPITKVAIPPSSDAMFSEEEHKHHILYSGTEVLQIRGGKELKALVIKTGFYTVRGELVRSILFPKPVDMHFYADFLKMLCIFLILGLAAMSWSFHHFYSLGASWSQIFLNSLDLITFVVPHVLPAAITAINASAQGRLRKDGIFCLSSNYISLSGSVDVVCFDKTGTLTESDLALAGVVPCHRGELQQPECDISKLRSDLPLATSLATCHSLTNIDGKLVGYPLDVKIFTGIGWTMIEPEPVINQDYGMVTPVLVRPKADDGDPEQLEVAIVKSFPFKSKEQRMTVVTKRKFANNFDVYIKGAPEMIALLCNDVTVPGILDSTLEWYTRQGLRVVAVAHAALPASLTWEQIETSPREKLEDGAEFLGLVILQNKVKKETPSVIATLHQADIRTVMITGDNLLTAVSVARQSGLLKADQQLIVARAQMVSTSTIAAQYLQVNYYDVEHIDVLYDKRKLMSVRSDNYVLAVDGQTFELIFRGQDEELYQRLIERGKIFARMKPDQKISIVEALQDLGHQVAMCGDGCNDCGALKVAHTGISLSSSEASVAAPFTSKLEDISSVVTVIREGRAALVSIFTAFKYDVSMCFGALLCVLFQFKVDTMPSDTQYLVMDLVLATIPALVIGNTGAPPILVPKRPTQRILSILPALSMLSFLAIQILTYWTVMTYIESHPWYERFFNTGDILPPKPNHENTALTLVNFHSYNVGVLVYSHAQPYRKYIYTNYMLFGYLIWSVVFCLFVNFYTGQWMMDLLNFYPFPDSTVPAMIFFIVSISFLISFIWERWVLYGLFENYILPWLHKTCGPHAPHVKLEKKLVNEEWPPLSDPVLLEAPITINAGPPLKAMESLNTYDDDPNSESMLIRKLTRRHRFKASVKYIKENESPISPTAPVDVPGPHSPVSSYPSPPPESASYQVPWELQENDGSAFKFNRSVRQQIMKGTDGVFSTFRGGATKRQTSHDTNTAEPYEVIRLSDNAAPFVDDDEIYSTIPDPPPSYVEDKEKDEGRNSNSATLEQGSMPIYEEDEGKPKTYSTPVSFPEEPHMEQQFIYDVPQQPPKPLKDGTEIRSLMSQLSYIDDEQSGSH